MTYLLCGYQFNIFEIPLLVYLISCFTIKLPFVNNKIIIEDKKYLNLFFMSYILLFISKIITFWPAINKTLVISDLFKWIEIFLFVSLVFNFKNFKHIYWILFLINISPSLISIYFSILNYNFFSGYRVLAGYSSIFSLSLLLPFVKKNKFIWLICLLLGCSVILSLTRGAWLALVIILFYFSIVNWKTNKRQIFKMAGITLIFILILTSIPAVQENIGRKTLNLFTLDSISNRERAGMFVACFGIFFENPLIGIGSGNFGSYLTINPYLYMGPFSDISENMGPHTFFLQVLVENGIIGLISCLMIFLILYKILFNKKLYLMRNDCKSYVLGLKMLFLSLIIHLIFGYVAGSGRLLLGIFMGLSLSMLKKGSTIYNIEK